jgi:hypothetical protein
MVELAIVRPELKLLFKAALAVIIIYLTGHTT